MNNLNWVFKFNFKSKNQSLKVVGFFFQETKIWGGVFGEEKFCLPTYSILWEKLKHPQMYSTHKTSSTTKKGDL